MSDPNEMQEQALEGLLADQRAQRRVEMQPAWDNRQPASSGWAFVNVNGHLGPVTSGDVIDEHPGADGDE
jgi:hypothetical protein